MEKIKVSYKLKLLSGEKVDQQELTRAIDIYVKNTPVHEKTSSNEFQYWAEHYKEYGNDDIFIFGFYKNNDLVGFGELAYFSGTKILILDYMTLVKDHCSNNVFFEFYSQIVSFMHENSYDFDYILSEIPFVEEGVQPSSDEKLWIKLLEMQNFKEIKAKYYQPSLSDRNPETETPGILMVFQRHQTSVIKKETLSMFIDTIYFSHYANWYKPRFKDPVQMNEYFDKLKEYKEDIMNSVGTSEVKLSGTSLVLPVLLPQKKAGHDFKLLSFVIPSMAIMISAFAGLMWLLNKSALSFELFSACAVAVFVIFFSLLAIISSDARGYMVNLLEKMFSANKH
jgi:hypothetical protein